MVKCLVQRAKYTLVTYVYNCNILMYVKSSQELLIPNVYLLDGQFQTKVY